MKYNAANVLHYMFQIFPNLKCASVVVTKTRLELAILQSMFSMNTKRCRHILKDYHLHQNEMNTVHMECLALNEKLKCRDFLDLAVAYSQMSTVIESTSGHTDRFHSGNENSLFEVKAILSLGCGSVIHSYDIEDPTIPGCLYYPEYGVATFVRADRDLEIHCLHDIVHCTMGIPTTLNSQSVLLRGGIRNIQHSAGPSESRAFVIEDTITLTVQR